MKKQLVLGVVVILALGTVGCEKKSSNADNMSEQESFVALQRDEIVTSDSEFTVEEVRWEGK